MSNLDRYITKVVVPKMVEWKSPELLDMDLGDGEGIRTFELLKGAQEYIHKKIDIKVSTSKELYKKAESLWEDLIRVQLNKLLDKPREIEQFSLDKPTVVYLVTENYKIVDIVDLLHEDYVNDFIEKHNDFWVHYTTNNITNKFFMTDNNMFIKYLCWDKNLDYATCTYLPVIFMELDYNKSRFDMYSGILVRKDSNGNPTYIYIPLINCDLSADSLQDFIKRFNAYEQLERSSEKAEELYEAYMTFEQNSVEISARELSTLLKKLGYKIEPDDVDNLAPIKNLVDEDSMKQIADFYNTFRFTTGENVLDIIRLSDFRKTFRYNKLTILDVLEIISKEYLTDKGNKITLKVLGDIVYKLYDTSNVDKSQVELIEKEQK